MIKFSVDHFSHKSIVRCLLPHLNCDMSSMVIDSESRSFFLQFDLLLGYASNEGFLYTGRLSDLNSFESCMKFVVKFIRTQLRVPDQVTSSLEIVVHIVLHLTCRHM